MIYYWFPVTTVYWLRVLPNILMEYQNSGFFSLMTLYVAQISWVIWQNIFFCDWMNKTSYIRKKQTPLVNEVLLAQHLGDYSFILKIHATFPHKGCHILGSGPNSIKHNLGIKATEYRSSSSKTSTDQILKKYIFSHFY